MCTWDGKFVGMTDHVAQWSKDRSHKVGAVFVNKQQAVLSVGYNGFPRGINDDVEARHERPAKYLWTEHAERNGIYNAAHEGASLNGSTAYVNFFPCAECARGLIQCGVERVVAPKPDYDHHKYGENFKVSLEMLEEKGIDITYAEYNKKDSTVILIKSGWAKRFKNFVKRKLIKFINKL